MMNDAEALVEELRFEGISHPAVLDAIAKIPRDRFVSKETLSQAYQNIALPIDCQQTISQPYIVALMTQALFRHPYPKKILEIGTGSGYQAAILAHIFEEVYTIERIDKLALSAQKKIRALNLQNIHFKCDDGSLGWPEHAPYDGILVTACAERPPKALIEQLSAQGGVLVIPLGAQKGVQILTLIQKEGDKTFSSNLEYVSFVPLIEKNQSK